jgi:hypothetical protein
VPGLRKDCTRHRGFRPGVLILFLAAGLAALGGCSGRPREGSLPAGAWLQLNAGVFTPVTDPGAALAVPRAPWTVQSRVADMAFVGQELFCGVNGSGLAALGRDPDGGVSFSYHPDPLIFQHRTITTLVPRRDALVVHLYFNALLNDARPQDLSLGGISLVAWSAQQKDYAFLVPPFQRANPDWEAVGFATESADSFDLEWKYTDASETRFQYTRFHADSKAEDPEDRDTFLSSLGTASIDGPSVPPELSAFFAACRARLPAQPAGASLQFTVRSRESPVKRSYRSRRESESAVVIPVFEEKGSLLGLLPDGRVLRAAAGGAPVEMSLPRLPTGFRYTDVVKWGASLVAPWEETAFTDVGRAGLLVYPVPAL